MAATAKNSRTPRRTGSQTATARPAVVQPPVRPRAEASFAAALPPLDDRIRLRAYEIYRARVASGAAGDDVSDWLAAEGELTGASLEPSAAQDIEFKAASRVEVFMPANG